MSDDSKGLKGIIVSVGLGVLAFIGIFFYPGSFFIHPTFNVQVNDSGAITITNTGWIQAKAVRVQFTPNDLSGLTYISCPELTSISKTNYTDILNSITGSKGEKFTFESALEFDRMSTNLPCEIKPYNNEGELTKVTVTADNSPAFVWTKKSNQTISLIDIFQETTLLSTAVISAAIIVAISRVFMQRY